jgi:glucose/arabinose dehydrogenase
MRRVNHALLGLLLALFGVAALHTQPSYAQNPTPTPQGTPIGQSNTIEGSAVITKTLPFEESFLERLKLPQGFTINIFARGLGNVRMMAFAPDGTLLVTRRNEADVIALPDANKDGTADSNAFNVVAANLPYIHGIAVNNNQVYLATDTSVFRTTVSAQGVLGTPQPLITDLPTGGQHPNRTLAIGPDGLLYITVGSTCNACDETDPEAATILQAQANGASRVIYAEGLRNTIGFGWHPKSGELWGFDHGSDWRGDDQPPEELNKIQQGKNYGWPWCFADQQPDVFTVAPPPGNTGRAAFCARTMAATLTYTAHSAPIGMVFYTGNQFPSEYVNDAFVAMRGSWNRKEPSGYKVVRIRFDQDGQPTAFEDFLTGFLIADQLANFGRIAGLVVAPDGSLFLSEDQNGIIYRIAYKG